MLIMIFSGYIYMKRYYKCIDSKFNWYNIDFILPIICFSFIFGIRYNVGNDYMSYLDIYEGYAHYYTIRDDLEIGFEFVTRLMAETGLHYSIYFGLIAFLQIFLIYYTFRKDVYKRQALRRPLPDYVPILCLADRQRTLYLRRNLAYGNSGLRRQYRLGLPLPETL